MVFAYRRKMRIEVNLGELQRTIERLHTGGELSAVRAQTLRRELPGAVAESSYILRHLGVHLAIGAVFAFDVIPLPLGTIGRVLWVLLARVYESLFGTWERAQVHSLKVVLVAAFPWIGYGAYLLALRRRNPELTWLLANYLSYRFYGGSLDEVLSRKPRLIRRAGQRLFPPMNEESACGESSTR